MTMKDHDRKKLWGQAAATCSMCRKPLVSIASNASDPDALIGEEAHIISASRRGPRGAASVAGMDLDGYYNKILLCRVHHRIVDEQTNAFPVEKLREIKSQHEEWVRNRLHVIDGDVDNHPFGLRHKSSGSGMILPRLRNGKDAWHAVAGSSFYLLESIDEDEGGPAACEAADSFLALLRDTAEIYDVISDGGPQAIRSAQRDLRSGLDNLERERLSAFGALRAMLLTGGATPVPCTMAVAVVRPTDTDGESESLPIAFGRQS
ncbi:hypothetical protein [Mycobacterium sp. Root265]|uniref:hypothetical protein n=1 Tax=Mycobacterium sp. Root265 TaxID=1736504 RepID=UPI000ACF6F06|nr:hypothetical protein [Mycobacterium sp. Root265]